MVSPADHRAAVAELLADDEAGKLSVSRACAIVSPAPSTCRYKARTRDDKAVEEQLSALTQKHPSIGFWSCHYRLRNKGGRINHKRLYRIYTSMKLNIRRKTKKRLPERVKLPLSVPTAPNQCWSLDSRERRPDRWPQVQSPEHHR